MGGRVDSKTTFFHDCFVIPVKFIGTFNPLVVRGSAPCWADANKSGYVRRKAIVRASGRERSARYNENHPRRWTRLRPRQLGRRWCSSVFKKIPGNASPGMCPGLVDSLSELASAFGHATGIHANFYLRLFSFTIQHDNNPLNTFDTTKLYIYILPLWKLRFRLNNACRWTR